MINEDKIREVWASNPERGFKLLIDFFQQPIYWHIRRLVVSHEDMQRIFCRKSLFASFAIFLSLGRKVHWEHGFTG